MRKTEGNICEFSSDLNRLRQLCGRSRGLSNTFRQSFFFDLLMKYDIILKLETWIFKTKESYQTRFVHL